METGVIPCLSAPHISIVAAAPAADVIPFYRTEVAKRPVRILENLNPFHPEECRAKLIDPFENESVAALVVRAGYDPANYEISRGGVRIADAEIWRTVARPGQEIVLCTRAGGGSWKSLLGMVAGLVVVGLMFFFMPALAAALGPALVSTFFATGAAVGAAVMSWALAPGLPHPQAWSATYDPTGPKGLAQPGVPVPKGYGKFGWCGNTVSSYVSYDGKDAYINALICYGWGPASTVANPRLNLKPISAYQNCNYQVRYGTNDQGPIDGFDRTVNGYPQEIDLLVASGAVTVPGTGTNVQGLEVTVKFPGGLYRITNDGNQVPLKFIYKIEVAPHGTSSWQSPLFPAYTFTQSVATTHMDGTQTWPLWVVQPTDRFAKSGIVYAYDNGSHYPGEPWSNTESVTVYNLDTSTSSTSVTFQGEWQPCDPNLNPALCTRWYEGYVVVEESSLSAFFNTQSVYGLAAGQWDVRVTPIGYCRDDNHDVVFADSNSSKLVCDCWLWNINEIFWSNLSYPNMILVGVKALATSQMSGANLQVQCDVTHDIGVDTVLPAALAGFSHDNPAIVAYDVLMNPVYGAVSVAPQLTVDVPAFVAWAQFNDELVTNQDGTSVRRHIFNGVFDQAADCWKTLQTIGNMSRANIFQVGNMYTVVVDAPADPVQLFTVGNTSRDSFQEMWLSLDERCTLIECDFADGARNYRMDLPVAVMTAADINSGMQPKPTRTRLLGCTSRDQAWRWAYFQLMSSKLTLRTIQITAPMEAVCCRRGSVIAVQADVTEWATGGRIQAGSTLSTVNVDRDDLTFAPSAGWTVSVQHPVLQRGSATVSAISGTTVTMTAALPVGRIVKAVGPDGTEYVVTGYGGSAITVETLTPQASTVALAAGQTVTLWDQNVIEALSVTAVTETAYGAQVAVEGEFAAVPSTDSAWAYGQSAGAQPAKLFRVVSIKRAGDFNFQIGAVEYNPAIYDDVIPAYGEIVGIPDSTPAITDLTLTEQFQNGVLTGSGSTALVAVGWRIGNTAVGAKVEIQSNGGASGIVAFGNWTSLGDIYGQGCSFVGYIGTTYNVRLTGFDWQGNPLGDPVLGSITVAAATNAPPNVTGFTGYQTATETVLSWNAVTPTPDHYEIRYTDDLPTAAAWNKAGVLWDGSGTTWTDTTPRTGFYMIAAVSSLAAGGLTSQQAATWQAEQQFSSGAIVSLPQQPTMTVGTDTGNPGHYTIAVDLPAQTALGSDGSEVSLPDQHINYYGLSASTTYYIYAWLDNSATLQVAVSQGVEISGVMPTVFPDTAPNAAHAAQASTGMLGWILICNTATGPAGSSFSYNRNRPQPVVSN